MQTRRPILVTTAALLLLGLAPAARAQPGGPPPEPPGEGAKAAGKAARAAREEAREAREQAREAREQAREARQEAREVRREVVAGSQPVEAAAAASIEARMGPGRGLAPNGPLAASRRALRDAIRLGDRAQILLARDAWQTARRAQRDARQEVHAAREALRDAHDATQTAAVERRQARRALWRARAAHVEAWAAHRARRRHAIWERLRGAGAASPVALDARARAELRHHAIRMARLERVRQLAQERGDAEAVARVDELIELEAARHAGFLARFNVDVSEETVEVDVELPIGVEAAGDDADTDDREAEAAEGEEGGAP